MQPIAVVGVEREQRGAELVHQRVVERVELLRPVERDQAGAARAAAAHLGQDAFVGGHGGLPCRFGRSETARRRAPISGLLAIMRSMKVAASCSMRIRTGR